MMVRSVPTGRFSSSSLLLMLAPAWLAVGLLVSRLQWVWTHRPELQFGWIVLLLSAYMFLENWSTRPAPVFRADALDWFAAGLGISLLILVQAYQSALGTSAAVHAGHAAAMVLVAFASVRSVFGWRGWYHLGFPFLFLLVAVPLPSAIQNPVTSFLQNIVTTVNIEALNLFGIPARRLGGLIQLPSGTIGVDEACSGIRSLQSSIMATLFIGHLTLRSNLLRGLLLVGGVAVAVFGNMLRSLFLSFIAYRHGVESIGRVHDSAGWSILAFTAIGVGLLAFFANSLHRKTSTGRAAPRWPAGSQEPRSPKRRTAPSKSIRSTRHKRLLDLFLILLSAPAWLPLMVCIAALVRLKMGAPVLFAQDRPGLKGRIFRMYKFRTMTDERDGEGRLLPDAERLTAFGRWLRRSSLDELPELLNVMRGEMSLVGPRPLLARYLTRYSPEQARRHEVLPGISGWAQVNGRNAISWEDKFRLDIWYVDHVSLALDVRILITTLWKVVRRDGISAAGEATMPEFMGALEGTDFEPK
jgi:sugar transferase EpsL